MVDSAYFTACSMASVSSQQESECKWACLSDSTVFVPCDWLITIPGFSPPKSAGGRLHVLGRNKYSRTYLEDNKPNRSHMCIHFGNCDEEEKKKPSGRNFGQNQNSECGGWGYSLQRSVWLRDEDKYTGKEFRKPQEEADEQWFYWDRSRIIWNKLF